MVQGRPEPQGKGETVVRNPRTHLSVPLLLPFLHRPRSSPLKRDQVLVAPGPWASSCVLKVVSRKTRPLTKSFPRLAKSAARTRVLRNPCAPSVGKPPSSCLTFLLVLKGPGTQLCFSPISSYTRRASGLGPSLPGGGVVALISLSHQSPQTEGGQKQPSSWELRERGPVGMSEPL